jgi:hypothetical protein
LLSDPSVVPRGDRLTALVLPAPYLGPGQPLYVVHPHNVLNVGQAGEKRFHVSIPEAPVPADCNDGREKIPCLVIAERVDRHPEQMGCLAWSEQFIIVGGVPGCWELWLGRQSFRYCPERRLEIIDDLDSVTQCLRSLYVVHR